MGIDTHMARFASEAVRAATDCTANRDSPADACSKSYEDDIINTLSDTRGHFCNQRACGVVVDSYRCIEFARNCIANRYIDHALQVGSGAQHITIVNQTSQTDTETAFNPASSG
jgi:hypothetical protein